MAAEMEHASPDTIARQAAIGAALARAGQGVCSAGILIGLAAVVVGPILLSLDADRPFLTIVVLTTAQASLLVLGLYLGFRTQFDADLFADLARAPDLAHFDASMVALGLMPGTKSGRPMQARIDGVKRLIGLQAGGVAAQLALLLGLLVGGSGH